MAKESEKGDPRPGLGRPGLSRRFAEIEDRLDQRVALRWATYSEVDKALDEMAKGLDLHDPPAAERMETARTALAAGEKRGRGRPKTAKPWAGICSKAEWYRREKAKKAGQEEA